MRLSKAVGAGLSLRSTLTSSTRTEDAKRGNEPAYTPDAGRMSRRFTQKIHAIEDQKRYWGNSPHPCNSSGFSRTLYWFGLHTFDCSFKMDHTKTLPPSSVVVFTSKTHLSQEHLNQAALTLDGYSAHSARGQVG